MSRLARLLFPELSGFREGHWLAMVQIGTALTSKLEKLRTSLRLGDLPDDLDLQLAQLTRAIAFYREGLNELEGQINTIRKERRARASGAPPPNRRSTGGR